MLKSRGVKSKVFYDGLAKNLDTENTAALIDNDEKDRIDFGTTKWHANHGTSLVALDKVIAVEARQMFRFMDKEKKGVIRKEQILNLAKFMQLEYYDPQIKAKEHAVMRKLERIAKCAHPDQLFTEDNFALYMYEQRGIYADRSIPEKPEIKHHSAVDAHVQQNLFLSMKTSVMKKELKQE